MTYRVRVGGLQVAQVLYDFVQREALPGSGVGAERFWHGVESVIADLMPKNLALLAERAALQRDIDEWHRTNRRQHSPEFIAFLHEQGLPRRNFDYDRGAYRTFLESIGYLREEPDDFQITTSGVDPEISTTAGPQLVVPVLNARFAINAANARWGSLYDALYGTNVIADHDGAAYSLGYGSDSREKVIAFARGFLDDVAPLSSGSHTDSVKYFIDGHALAITLADGSTVGLSNPSHMLGYQGRPDDPTSILLIHNGLHVEVQISPLDKVRATDPAGVEDVVLESAVTTIMDLEDSVAAVDADDKVQCYRNWLGLMRGDLTQAITTGGETVTRSLNPDRVFTSLSGPTIVLPGRALLLVRNVGHHMMTDAVLDADGHETPEGILDALITALAATHSLTDRVRYSNSRTGSVYIVKPKMHGPDEVAFSVELFDRVEKVLELPTNTLKVGIMDEERRTTVNLKACIKAAADRIVFINTGFLDRTGDEIHTSMNAGPVVPKGAMKACRWITAYEQRNVHIGLSTGFQGKAQIGKGMWAMLDLMAEMLEQKIAHPLAGASTAWVPSPTAATLHAVHYHKVDVASRQQDLTTPAPATMDEVLEIPLAVSTDWTAEQRRTELDTNTQSILGYVVRWINDGVGCTKVPDINNVALMEDRATLRISSQFIANWLHHGILTEAEISDSLQRMARVVDRQNALDPTYRPLAADFDSSIAFQTARDLILQGTTQACGYTEPILHRRRREYKAAQQLPPIDRQKVQL